jgi:uncharacterized caspase-like protein
LVSGSLRGLLESTSVGWGAVSGLARVPQATRGGDLGLLLRPLHRYAVASIMGRLLGGESEASAQPVSMRGTLLGIIVVLISLAGAKAETRVALVIGNSDYRFAPTLKNPANDARAVAAALQHLGFDVGRGAVINADREQMIEALHQFRERARQADVTLVYYSGHGIQVDGHNYLIPVDARLRDPVDLDDTAILQDRVAKELQGREINILILDACRTNPFSQRLQDAARARIRSLVSKQGLAPTETSTGPAGMLIEYATSPDAIADDGDGPHSPYTLALLKHIEDTDVELRLVFGRVQEDVVKVTQDRQRPWEQASLGAHEFYFKASQAKPVTTTPVEPASAFVICYSDRLDALFRERELACGLDRVVDDAEAESIARRLSETRLETAGERFRVAAPGTTLVHSAGQITYVATDDMVVTTLLADGSIMYRFAMFFEVTIQQLPNWKFAPREAEKIWPLVIGKEVTFPSSRATLSWRQTIKVLRRDKILVPAGEFDVYVIERHEKGLAGNSFDGVYTYWYAPSEGLVVKFDLSVKAGPGESKGWEAEGIIRPHQNMQPRRQDVGRNN